MQLTTDIKSVRTASAEIIKYIRKEKKAISKDTLFDIKLCVEEAIRNAVVHGNENKADLPIEISFSIKGDKIKITICDSGKGFVFGDLPDPTDGKNLHKESGRGIYIMHRLMDKLEYNEKGNCVTMEKRLI